MSNALRMLALVSLAIGAGANITLAQPTEQLRLPSVNQVPGLSDQMSDKVAITNLGEITFKVLYFENAWKTTDIAPNATALLPSPADGLKVSFNDGSATQNRLLATGVRYAIRADAKTGLWAMVPYAEVGRASTGLRSQ